MGDGKWTFRNINVSGIIKVVKGISLDKWFLIGAAGLVLVLCSDSSCQGNSVANENGSDSKTGLFGADEKSGYEINNSDNNNSIDYMSELDTYTAALEKKLGNILMSVEGAGKVQVMITLKNTSTKEVLMEEPYSESNVNEKDGDGGSRDKSDKNQDYHVIYKEDGNGTLIPFVVSEYSPQVEGVAVVAQGGDSAVVKEKITGIIKALFGIEINKIAVGKMK